jgi:hypothetical protein
MKRWHNEVGDMLTHVNDVLQPHEFDDVVKDNFAALRHMLEERTCACPLEAANVESTSPEIDHAASPVSIPQQPLGKAGVKARATTKQCCSFMVSGNLQNGNSRFRPNGYLRCIPRTDSVAIGCGSWPACNFKPGHADSRTIL